MNRRVGTIVSFALGLLVGSAATLSLAHTDAKVQHEQQVDAAPDVDEERPASAVLFKNVDGTQEWGFVLEPQVDLLEGIQGNTALSPSNLEILRMEVVSDGGHSYVLRPDTDLSRLLLDRYGQRQG